MTDSRFKALLFKPTWIARVCTSVVPSMNARARVIIACTGSIRSTFATSAVNITYYKTFKQTLITWCYASMVRTLWPGVCSSVHHKPAFCQDSWSKCLITDPTPWAAFTWLISFHLISSYLVSSHLIWTKLNWTELDSAPSPVQFTSGKMRWHDYTQWHTHLAWLQWIGRLICEYQ